MLVAMVIKLHRPHGCFEAFSRMAPNELSVNEVRDMPRTYISLTLDDAKRMLSPRRRPQVSASHTASPWSMPVVTFLRQGGALIGSVDLAIDKAATARIFDKTEAVIAGVDHIASSPDDRLRRK
jgi:hypothetical protein